MINPLSNPSYLLPPLIAVCVIIGLLVLVWQKSQRDFSSQVFCGLLLSLGLWSLFTFGMRSSPDVEHALPWEKALIVVGVPVFVLYYHFTVAYTKIRRKKWIIPAIYSFLVVFVVLVIAPDLAIKGMSLEHYGYAPIIGPIGFLIFAPIPLLVVGGAYNLLKSYGASSSSEERNRLLYLTIAALFPLLGAGLDAFSDLPPASIWSNLIFGIICSIAILKYHLLDIRIVLRRGLAYLLTSVLVAVPFVVLLVLPSLVLAPGLEPWWYGLIILLLAIILRPLYGWAQVLVDKLFYRERYDYLKALQQFSRQAQSIVNVEDLGSSMVRLVSGALRTKAASLLLPSQGNGGLAVISSTLESPPRGIVLRQQSRIVNWLEHHQDTLFSEDFDIVTQLQSLSLTEKNSLEQMGARLYVPIKTRKGELAGVLILGSKLSQQSFSDEDKHLLTALSSQMAMALENARLYSDALRARESLERWLDGMTDCVMIVNIDYTVKFMNRAAIDKLGSRVGENCWNATGKETVCPSCPIQNYVQGSREGLFYSQNIGDREYDIAAAPLLNPDGSLSIVEVLRDITERKRAEEALRESEEFSSSLLTNLPNPMLVANSDTSLKYVNPALEKLTGFSLAEVSDRKVPYPWWTEETLPKTRMDFEEAMHKGVERREELFQKKNGERFWVEITATSVMQNGEFKYFLANWVDITERKQAEERIKRAAEEWRTTFDSITDLVSICDKDFKLVRVNKAFADAFKMKPVEIIGKTCYEIAHGTNRPIPNCPQKVTIKTKKPATAEFFEPHLGIHLETTTSPIFNEKGEVVACVHVTRDITERKQMEEQLIVTDRLASVGELASGIAHELNNPLTSVIGFSQLLLEKDVPDDVKEDVKIIYSEAQRTAQVVKNLLTFARKHDTEKGPVNISSIMEKVLELRAYEQRVSNIQVNTMFAPDLPEITADYFQLQQVFLNIVINAEHFMIEANNRGTLTITTERAGDIIRASLADDGPGISKEDLGHLFDPFFTTKEVGKGTGLGLSICHGIITEHGGRIYAESEFGKGATFVVELPIIIDRKGAVE